MPKVVIDPGHGGYDPGAVGPGGIREKDVTLKISLQLRNLLLANGIEVKMTRDSDAAPGGSNDLNTELRERVRISEAFMGASGLFLSIHLNSIGGNPQVDGTETLIYVDGGNAGRAARLIQEELVAVTGVQNRGVKVQNVLVLRETSAPAVLTESVFISNSNEAQRLQDANFISKLAEAHAKGVCRYFGFVYKGSGASRSQSEGQPGQSKKETIMGKSQLDAYTMNSFVRKVNPGYRDIADLFLSIGAKYGVRGDIAFAQSIKETGYFRFGGAVPAEYNNFAGLGATGGGVPGARFKTPEEGIEAQMQHLFAYATKEPLKYPLVDPRFHLVSRGTAPNWEDLNGRWAVPGNNYGQEILQIWHQMKNFAVSPTSEPNGTKVPAPSSDTQGPPTTEAPKPPATEAPKPPATEAPKPPATEAPKPPATKTPKPPAATEAPKSPVAVPAPRGKSLWRAIADFFRSLFGLK